MNIVSNSSFNQIFQIFQIRFFYHLFHFVRRRRYYYFYQSNYIFVANLFVAQILYQRVVMTFTYKKHLIIFKKWFYIKFLTTNIIAIEFCHISMFRKSNINDVIICLKCFLLWNDWYNDDNFLQIHLNTYENCTLIQTLNEKKKINSNKKNCDYRQKNYETKNRRRRRFWITIKN